MSKSILSGAILIALAALFIIPASASSQTTGSISGVVVTEENVTVAGATVEIVGARRSVRSGADGTFRVDGVAPGRYAVQATHPRFGSGTTEVRVVAGGLAEVTVTVEVTVHTEAIVVSATPDERGVAEIAQPVTVLAAEELQLRRQPTIGETLNEQPGVTSTYFGPGASRPVIRGLGGDRIRILEEGIGAGDASNMSPDHAVSIEPSAAEQIEIIRGPATLLYGSNAVGGVVNVLQNRVPARSPGTALTGTVDLGFSTVASERSGAFRAGGEEGKLVWSVQGSRRTTDDYEVPGGSGVDEHGVLENSALSTGSASAGISWIGSRGFLGVAVSGYETRYGIPGHGAHGDDDDHGDEEEEEGVEIDLEQRRFDLSGEMRTPFRGVRSLRIRGGVTDYRHFEIEEGEIATTFENDAWETRIEALHDPIGRVTGAVGLQFVHRDFGAFGEEAFVPPSKTDTRALFVFEEVPSGDLTFQFGARYENQDITVRHDELPDRSFAGVSASLGAVWRVNGAWSVGTNLARAVRLPTAEELYSDGPHLATASFEVGDPDLDEETSLGLDLSIRRLSGRITGELNLFANRFSDFIFTSPTGEEEDDLPVFAYGQQDARFSGAELHADIDLIHAHPHRLELELSADWVRAELASSGEPLPRISPARFGVGLRYAAENVWGLAEVRRVTRQNRVADFEEPTDGYTMLNASVGYRFLARNTLHELMLRGTNLTDELARSHVSPLKNVAPLPGRDFRLSYRLVF
jgi:iron complex outermembrane recepter protein